MTTELLAAAEEMKDTERKCVWELDEIDYIFDTSCDTTFGGDCVGKRYNYCPNCGGKIEVK